MEHIASFNLDKRYGQAQKIHGSRVNHHFMPVDGARKMRL